jgi:hypothetical protein
MKKEKEKERNKLHQGNNTISLVKKIGCDVEWKGDKAILPTSL